MPNDNTNNKDQGESGNPGENYFVPLDSDRNIITSVTKTLLPGRYSWIGAGVGRVTPDLALVVDTTTYFLQATDTNRNGEHQHYKLSLMKKTNKNNSEKVKDRIGSSHFINGSGSVYRFGFRFDFAIKNTPKTVILKFNNGGYDPTYTTFDSSVINRQYVAGD